jgi:flagellar assembly factor FliW
MKIKTKALGEIEISEERIIHLEEGIIGFKDIKEYVLLNAGEQSPFMWLQSIKEPDLAFIVIPPSSFYPDYKLEVAKEDLDAIGLDNLDDAAILAIVVVPEDPSKMSANLLAPIVINSKTWKGRQMISTNPKYTVRHYIIEEMQALIKKKE